MTCNVGVIASEAKQSKKIGGLRRHFVPRNDKINPHPNPLPLVGEGTCYAEILHVILKHEMVQTFMV